MSVTEFIVNFAVKKNRVVLLSAPYSIDMRSSTERSPKTAIHTATRQMAGKNTFKKEERLSRKRDIEDLFSVGKPFSAGPFKVLIKEVEEGNAGLSVMPVVPKRNFKRAVDRNRIKRLIREAWRLNKHPTEDALKERDKKINAAVIFRGKRLPEYAEVEDKIILILRRLIESIKTEK